MIRFLLDTDTCIDVLRGNERIVERVRSRSPRELATSVVTRYELIYGTLRCDDDRRQAERTKVERLLERIRTLPLTDSIADRAAQIRNALASRGTPIGPYDILIAATALDAGLELVSDNLDEFQRVPGLRCAGWR